jgi:drug/metabolite transporter (DMT)-like permease
LSLALGLAPIAVVSPLASLATGLSVLYGVVVLRERVSPLALLGAAAASAGVFLVSV